MTVTRYEFGHITIDGQEYDKDVIVCEDKVDSPWWRIEGHNLYINDLNSIIEDHPEVLVIGTGYYGRMHVANEVLQELRDRGIEPQVYTTPIAVKSFNRLQDQRKHVAAAFHLTC